MQAYVLLRLSRNKLWWTQQLSHWRVSVVTVRKKMVLKGQRAFNATLFDFAGTWSCIRNLLKSRIFSGFLYEFLKINLSDFVNETSRTHFPNGEILSSHLCRFKISLFYVAPRTLRKLPWGHQRTLVWLLSSKHEWSAHVTGHFRSRLAQRPENIPGNPCSQLYSESSS